MELFRKSDNWRQIYKQASSTLYILNDMQNSCLVTFLKNTAPTGGAEAVTGCVL